MTNRRQILQYGLALPALAASVPAWQTLAAAPQAVRLERFIFDARFAESAAMGEHAVRLGIEAAPIADDLMSLWYDELDRRWRSAPMALAGVTMAEALFVLETFALDRGMHVVYRGEHGAVAQGHVMHRLAGPAAVLERVAPLPAAWAPALCDALAHCPVGKSPTVTAEHRTSVSGLSLRDVVLHSWIIAPRSVVPTMVAGK